MNDDTSQPQTRPPRRGTLRRAVAAMGLLLVAAGLLAAGAYWHGTIGGWFGWSDSNQPLNVPDLAAGSEDVWGCGMHPQVIQEKPGICPICRMKLEPISVGKSSARGGKGERKVKYWWDPMLGPSSIADKPGKSAMGMDLVPVYEDEVSGGTAVTIDPVIVQNMGVRVAEVESGTVSRTIRAVGYLEQAQPNIHDVNLRVSGWIEKLHANTEGQHLTKGDPLFDLYSPELQVAIEELIGAQRGSQSLTSDSDDFARRNADVLLDAARGKLQQWGLSTEQVDEFAKLDMAPRLVTFTSPITGHVVEKHVVEGAAVKAGDRVLRIVDHSTLWLDAQVFEQDLPLIRLGEKATATVVARPGEVFEGEVMFIHPHLDPATRTTTVRVAVPNPELVLRPGMFATMSIEAEAEEATPLVPREAVIDTGTRQLVFVVAGEGRFEPRNVKLGVINGNGVAQVLTGLAPGEVVVTSGQFLLDAESRMTEAIQRHLDSRLLAKREKSPATAVPESDTADDPLSVPDLAQQIEWSADMDKVYGEYLAITKLFGAAEPPTEPVDANNLIRSARALVDVTPDPNRRFPKRVLDSANAMKDKPAEEQRNLLKDLSHSVIAMAQVCPPSSTVADELFVLYCPMKKSHWLQDKPDVANPYYADEMKDCGQVKRTIKSSSEPK